MTEYYSDCGKKLIVSRDYSYNYDEIIAIFSENEVEKLVLDDVGSHQLIATIFNLGTNIKTFLCRAYLDNQLIKLIESYLSTNDKLEKLCLKCSTTDLSKLVQNIPSKLKKLKLIKADFSNSQLEILLKNFEYGEKLYFECACNCNSSLISDFLEENQRLTTLSLQGCKNLRFGEIMLSIETNNILTKLDISCSNLDFESVNSIAKMLENNKILEKLYMNDCIIDQDAFGKICDSLEKNNILNTLHLRGYDLYNIKRANILKINQMLCKNTTLTDLNLCGNFVQDIQLNNNIRKLDICDILFETDGDLQSSDVVCIRGGKNNVNCSNLDAIIEELMGKNIETLSLRKNNFFGEISLVEKFGNFLITSNTIQDLYLVDTGLNSDNIKILLNTIAINNTLTSLDLSASDFLHLDIENFCQKINQNHTLKKLSLEYCSINEEDVIKLANNLILNNTLVEICIDTGYDDINNERDYEYETWCTERYYDQCDNKDVSHYNRLISKIEKKAAKKIDNINKLSDELLTNLENNYTITKFKIHLRKKDYCFKIKNITRRNKRIIANKRFRTIKAIDNQLNFYLII